MRRFAKLLGRGRRPALSSLSAASGATAARRAGGRRGRAAAHLDEGRGQPLLSCRSGRAPARAGRTGCSGPLGAKPSAAVRRPLTSSRALPFHALQPLASTMSAIGRSSRSSRRRRCSPERRSTSRSKRSRSGSASSSSASLLAALLHLAVEPTSARPERISTSPPSRARAACRSPPCRPELGDVEPADADVEAGQHRLGLALGFSFGRRWRMTSSESRSSMISRLVIQPSGCQSRSIREDSANRPCGS
jgi:hypothetical protein